MVKATGLAKVIGATVEEDIWEWLVEEAVREERSIAYVIRKVLREAMCVAKDKEGGRNEREG